MAGPSATNSLNTALYQMKTLEQLDIAENERQAIEAASKILKEMFPVRQVVLFGSKARGDYDEESDIDLLVLMSRPISWTERKAINDALYDIQLSYDVIISTLIATDEDWNEGAFSVLPIHDEVREHGILT